MKNDDGSWSGPGQEAQWYGSIRNPIGTLHMMTNETKGYNFLANITGEITFTKWLKLKSTFGYDAKFWFADNFTPAYDWKPNPVEESSRYKSDNLPVGQLLRIRPYFCQETPCRCDGRFFRTVE